MELVPKQWRQYGVAICVDSTMRRRVRFCRVLGCARGQIVHAALRANFLKLRQKHRSHSFSDRHWCSRSFLTTAWAVGEVNWRAALSDVAVLTFVLWAGFARAWLASGDARGPVEIVWLKLAGLLNPLWRRRTLVRANDWIDECRDKTSVMCEIVQFEPTTVGATAPCPGKTHCALG